MIIVKNGIISEDFFLCLYLITFCCVFFFVLSLFNFTHLFLLFLEGNIFLHGVYAIVVTVIGLQ